MKNKVLFATFLFSVAVILMFIYFSNDHAECYKEFETIEHSDGTSIITNKHICKENYNI